MYHYGEVYVEDFFEDKVDESGAAYFTRTLTFTTEAAPPPFYFRASCGDKVRVNIVTGREPVVREGDTKELLIPLNLPAGKTTLTLEYRW